MGSRGSRAGAGCEEGKPLPSACAWCLQGSSRFFLRLCLVELAFLITPIKSSRMWGFISGERDFLQIHSVCCLLPACLAQGGSRTRPGGRTTPWTVGHTASSYGLWKNPGSSRLCTGQGFHILQRRCSCRTAEGPGMLFLSTHVV